MRKNGFLASAVLGALVAFLAPLNDASGAHSATIRCGDTITANIVLTKDLTCPGDGLVVGATGLTIDLNRHTLTGSGVGIGIGGPQGTRVIRGTVRGFDVGLQGQAEVRSVKFASNRLGMQSMGGGTITDSTFESNGAGLIHGSGNQTITGTTFRKNGTGLSCGDANVVITGSRFTDNGTGLDASVCGIRIQESEFTGGDIAVKLHSQGYFLDVRNNSFVRAGIGLSLSGVGDSTHAIVGNVFKDNRASGLVVNASNSTWGYPLLVADNTFMRNGMHPGSLADPTGGSLTSGVWANAGTFTHNTARGNAGHGIAGYAVVDGGGNTARSNRAEPQCLGVVCRPRG